MFRQGRAIIAELAKQSPITAGCLQDLAAFDSSIAKLEQGSVPENSVREIGTNRHRDKRTAASRFGLRRTANGEQMNLVVSGHHTPHCMVNGAERSRKFVADLDPRPFDRAKHM